MLQSHQNANTAQIETYHDYNIPGMEELYSHIQHYKSLSQI